MKSKVLLFSRGLVLASNPLDQLLWAPSPLSFLRLLFLKDCFQLAKGALSNFGFIHGLPGGLNGSHDTTTAANCMVALSPLRRGLLLPPTSFSLGPRWGPATSVRGLPP